MTSTTEEYFDGTDADADETFKDYLKAIAIVNRPDYGIQHGHQQDVNEAQAGLANDTTGTIPSLKENNNTHLFIKKCSRCRMKRMHESEIDLHKYQTCAQCRAKRKVKERRPRQLSKLPNVSDDWSKFLGRVAMNHQVDLLQHNFRSFSDSNVFPRYKAEELSIPLIQAIGEKIVQTYISPIQNVTGFKFAIRDHHNPQLTDLNKAKKITWMYICSQDKTRRRKSRSENKRQIINKLKTEDCESKINLSYDIVNGVVQISYNHRHHKPSNTFKQNSSTDELYNLPLADDKSIHQQFQELQKQHQLLQNEEEEEEESLHRQRFYASKDPTTQITETAIARSIVESSSNDNKGHFPAQSEIEQNETDGKGGEDGEENESTNTSTDNELADVHSNSNADNKLFDAINMGIESYEDSSNGNVDVDVAEIAKLLKQVHQSTSSTSIATTPSNSGSITTSNTGGIHEQTKAHHDSANMGLEEIAALVGLGPEDLNLLNDPNVYVANQNLLEQVREQVRKGQSVQRNNDNEQDNENEENEEEQ